MKDEKVTCAVEMSDKEVLDMLAKLFGVGINPNSIGSDR